MSNGTHDTWMEWYLIGFLRTKYFTYDEDRVRRVRRVRSEIQRVEEQSQISVPLSPAEGKSIITLKLVVYKSVREQEK